MYIYIYIYRGPMYAQICSDVISHFKRRAVPRRMLENILCLEFGVPEIRNFKHNVPQLRLRYALPNVMRSFTVCSVYSPMIFRTRQRLAHR